MAKLINKLVYHYRKIWHIDSHTLHTLTKAAKHTVPCQQISHKQHNNQQQITQQSKLVY